MKVLWVKSPMSSAQIIAALADTESWHPNTIKTLLSRLYRKGAVGVKKQKNLYLYSPVVSEAQSVRAESESFLERIFGGAVKPLLVHFVERQKLSARDVEELKEILKRKQK